MDLLPHGAPKTFLFLRKVLFSQPVLSRVVSPPRYAGWPSSFPGFVTQVPCSRLPSNLHHLPAPNLGRLKHVFACIPLFLGVLVYDIRP